MGDPFYRLVRMIGSPVLWATSRPVALNLDRTARAGGYILAPNHLSPYDVAVLVWLCRRPLDFVSITEMRAKPIVHRFFRRMNCEFIDRSRRDVATTAALAHRLKSGRVVAMFPEGGIRKPDNSVLDGAPFKPGVVRLAQITGVPIVPCALIGTAVYSHFKTWNPTRSARFGMNVGEPLFVSTEPAALAAALQALSIAYRTLGQQLKVALASS